MGRVEAEIKVSRRDLGRELIQLVNDPYLHLVTLGRGDLGEQDPEPNRSGRIDVGAPPR